jgi:hypothetical protein
VKRGRPRVFGLRLSVSVKPEIMRMIKLHAKQGRMSASELIEAAVYIYDFQAATRG